MVAGAGNVLAARPERDLGTIMAEALKAIIAREQVATHYMGAWLMGAEAPEWEIGRSERGAARMAYHLGAVVSTGGPTGKGRGTYRPRRACWCVVSAAPTKEVGAGAGAGGTPRTTQGALRSSGQ